METQEWKIFRNYLKGAVGTNSNAYKLYLIIQKERGDLDSPNMSIERISTKYFASIDRKTLLNIMSILVHEVLDFWTLVEMKKDFRADSLWRLKALNRRGLYKEANRLGAQLNKELTAPNRIDIWDRWYLLASNHTRFFSYNPIKNTSEGRTLLEDCFVSMDVLRDSMIAYYTIEAVNRTNLKRENWEEFLNNRYSSFGSIADTSLFFLSSLPSLIEHGDEKAEQVIYELLSSPNHNMGPELCIPCLVAYKRCHTRRFANGDISRISELATVNANCILYDRIEYNGVISNWLFLNAIAVNCVLGRFGVVDELVSHSASKLLESDTDEILVITKMTKALYQGLPEVVVDAYNSIKFKREYKILALSICIRAYSQSDSYDSSFLKYQIRNFSDVLKRSKDKIGRLSFEGNAEFVRILKLMINSSDPETVIHEINNSNSLFYRTWFMKVLGDDLREV